MPVDYGYLLSTKQVAKAVKNYDIFAADKAKFESVPNVNVSRSLDRDGRLLDPPMVRDPFFEIVRHGVLTTNCLVCQKNCR